MRNLKPKKTFSLSSNERLMGLIFLFPLSSLFALKELLDIKNTHKILLITILVFLSTQIISSIYTLNPTISILLSLVRCAIITGLIAYGFKYVDNLDYNFLGKTISFIGILATSFHFVSGYGFLDPVEFFYIISNSISILGALLIFIYFYSINGVPKINRYIFLLIGIWLAFSGQGRSTLIIITVGFLFNIKWTIQRVCYLIICTVVVFSIFIYQDLSQNWTSNSLAGREIVWEQAMNVFKAFPIGGTGSYQYASIANPFDNPCAISTYFDTLIQLFAQNQCPNLIQLLHKPWLIAHNGTLHALAENGIIGLFGWCILWGVAIMGAWQSQSQFIRATILGLLAANYIDNVTLIPSPGFSELFFILLGAAWSENSPFHWSSVQKTMHYASILGLSVGVSMLLIVLILQNHTLKSFPPVEIKYILSPKYYVENEKYATYLDLSDKNTKYEKNISIEQCTQYNICKVFGSLPWSSQNFSGWMHTKIEHPTTKMRLLLYYTSQRNLRFLIKEWTISPEREGK